MKIKEKVLKEVLLNVKFSPVLKPEQFSKLKDVIDLTLAEVGKVIDGRIKEFKDNIKICEQGMKKHDDNFLYHKEIKIRYEHIVQELEELKKELGL